MQKVSSTLKRFLAHTISNIIYAKVGKTGTRTLLPPYRRVVMGFPGSTQLMEWLISWNPRADNSLRPKFGSACLPFALPHSLWYLVVLCSTMNTYAVPLLPCAQPVLCLTTQARPLIPKSRASVLPTHDNPQ